MNIDFARGRILVIGDCMLDRYYFGSVGRVSPEAPVPVVKVQRNHDTLGGAGNVASNCAHLGAKVTLIGALGRDESGSVFRRLCVKNRITLASVPTVCPTITKTRVIGEHQQIVRIDFEEELPPGSALLARTLKTIRQHIDGVSAIVLSDYGKGLCSPDLCAFVIGECRRRNLPVIVDPKGSSWAKYRGAAIVTPNVKELGDVAGAVVRNDDAAVAAQAKTVRQKFSLGALLVTRSEKGMTLVNRRAIEHFPTEAREVFDVSGAGDTVVATLAAGLAGGFELHEAVVLANKAAGIVVGKIGTVPVEISELRAAIDGQYGGKLLSQEALFERCSAERKRGRTIVFANGCFDILHRGHVHLLREARKQGDVLVVALNSDRSIQALGRSMPVNTQADRAHLIAALDSVDCITLFDEKTPVKLLKKIKPDVIIKGGNYREDEIVGRQYAKRAVIISELEGYSTKDIIRKISSR